MECHVCGEIDTADNWCKCIICDECGTKTPEEKIVHISLATISRAAKEGMWCSAQCAEGGE
tara:strand:- start:10196 stop:10378 length:183 start_codon:yes stop_codon:yes gene_type:complete